MEFRAARYFGHLALTGQMPIAGTATGGTYLQPNIADVTVSNLLFDHGMRAHIFVSWLHPYKEQRLVVIGSKQMVVFEDSRPDNKLMLYDKQIELKNGRSRPPGRRRRRCHSPADEPLRRECGILSSAWQTRERRMTPGEEGVQVLQVLAGLPAVPADERRAGAGGRRRPEQWCACRGRSNADYFVHESSYVDRAL